MKINNLFRKSVYVVLIIVVLFSTGCVFSNSGYGDEDYRSGTDGIEVEFATTQELFYDNDYLNLEIEISNKGAFDDAKGKILLSGFDREVIKIKDEEIHLPELEGIDPFLPEGSSEFVEVEETGTLEVQLGESYDATIQLSTCYNYETIANPVVCLIYDYSDYEQREVCTTEPVYLSSQGAPVAVTNVQTELLRNEVNLIMTIENKGNGIVYKPEDLTAFENCPYSFDQDDLNYVKVSMEITGLGDAQCTPGDNLVKLVNGVGVIQCKFTLREESAYQTPVLVKLEYGYSETIQHEVSVYKAGGELTSVFDDERYEASSPVYTDDPNDGGSSDGGYGTGCPCSDANLNKWKGCICIYIDGNMYICGAGENVHQINYNKGDLVNYEIHGYSDSTYSVPYCGLSALPSDSCPYGGSFSMDTLKTLNIYGKTIQGTGVSEICKFIPATI